MRIVLVGYSFAASHASGMPAAAADAVATRNDRLVSIEPLPVSSNYDRAGLCRLRTSENVIASQRVRPDDRLREALQFFVKRVWIASSLRSSHCRRWIRPIVRPACPASTLAVPS